MTTKSKTYYNEFDKTKCAMLKKLMAEGYISKGVIDDRPIQEVRAADLTGFTRCHFFAGIGLWDHALNLAGWEEDRPVWTGSCPCQPFSSAGRQKGKADDRHLWPEWFRLIKECRPPTVFGEQVATAVTKGWLDDVYEGLEAQDYAVGAVVLPACSVGAPHKRDRLWFMANSTSSGLEGGTRPVLQTRSCVRLTERSPRTLGYAASEQGPCGNAGACNQNTSELRRSCSSDALGWGSAVWTAGGDAKARLVKPGIQLLADGHPARVGVLHAAGDAIVPQVAAEFIGAFLDV